MLKKQAGFLVLFLAVSVSPETANACTCWTSWITWCTGQVYVNPANVVNTYVKKNVIQSGSKYIGCAPVPYHPYAGGGITCNAAITYTGTWTWEITGGAEYWIFNASASTSGTQTVTVDCSLSPINHQYWCATCKTQSYRYYLRTTQTATCYCGPTNAPTCSETATGTMETHLGDVCNESILYQNPLSCCQG